MQQIEWLRCNTPIGILFDWVELLLHSHPRRVGNAVTKLGRYGRLSWALKSFKLATRIFSLKSSPRDGVPWCFRLFYCIIITPRVLRVANLSYFWTIFCGLDEIFVLANVRSNSLHSYIRVWHALRFTLRLCCYRKCYQYYDEKKRNIW